MTLGSKLQKSKIMEIRSAKAQKRTRLLKLIIEKKEEIKIMIEMMEEKERLQKQ